MNGIDKVWAQLGEHPIAWYALSRLSRFASATVLVVRSDQVDRAAVLAGSFRNVTAIAGGAERRDSVVSGLNALPTTEYVAVHDVARPLASGRLFETGLARSRPGAGVIPVLMLADTLKLVSENGRVMSTVDRGGLRAVQTPQFFCASTLRQVHCDATLRSSKVTDDASLLEIAGFPVETFDGSPENFKITTEYDLSIARLLVAHGAYS